MRTIQGSKLERITHRLFLPVVIGALLALAALPFEASVDVNGLYLSGGVDAGAGAAESRLATTAVAQLPRSTPGETAESMERALFDLTNEARLSNGLAPLAFDPEVVAVARARAVTQLTDAPLSHYNGDGQPALPLLLAESGVGFTRAGENLARWKRTDASVPSLVQQALMDSPTHRRNILEPEFDRLGIGAAVDGSGRSAFAEVFRAAP